MRVVKHCSAGQSRCPIRVLHKKLLYQLFRVFNFTPFCLHLRFHYLIFFYYSIKLVWFQRYSTFHVNNTNNCKRCIKVDLTRANRLYSKVNRKKKWKKNCVARVVWFGFGWFIRSMSVFQSYWVSNVASLPPLQTSSTFIFAFKRYIRDLLLFVNANPKYDDKTVLHFRIQLVRLQSLYGTDALNIHGVNKIFCYQQKSSVLIFLNKCD